MQKALRKALIRCFVSFLAFCSLPCFPNPLFEPNWTEVEERFIAKSSRQKVYPSEYIVTIEARNSYELGKLIALRFIEWLQNNPNGVVAFTSGSNPEFFIKFLDYYKHNWNNDDVQKELHSFGIFAKNFPKSNNLKLVQMEEMYPISDRHYKKISNYTIRHYAKLLQIKPENLLLMDAEKHGVVGDKGMNVVFMNGRVDLSITGIKATSQVELWQQRAIDELKQFCVEYEKKIRAWGGIDFFISSIGYDGQLGFIQPDTDLKSNTHILAVDYKTAAQCAKDVGGIEYVRGKIAITVGLGTLTVKPDAVMIVIANGEGKAQAVKNAVENTNNLIYPATVLQKYKNSRFYITDGAGKALDDRQTEDLRFKSKHGWMQKHVEEVITYIALEEKKPILSLSQDDLNKYVRGKLLMENPPKALNVMLKETHDNIIRKIELGAKLNLGKASKVMHTYPHHEDLVLGYYPLLDYFTAKFKNHFVYFTSGFNSVSDAYILSILNNVNDWWINKEQDNILKKPYEKILLNYKNFFIKQDYEQLSMQDSLIGLKCLVRVFDIKDVDELKHTIRWLKDEYFAHKQPGELDVAQVKMLKGLIRESEADRASVIRNIPLNQILHLRSKFYSGREFMRTPRHESDVLPFINTYNKIKPDILMVLDDPESYPPITNYRVLQIVAQGLRSKECIQNVNLQIFGYRSVWFRYRLSDYDAGNVFVPVSSKTLSSQMRIYNTCFSSQKKSQYPSPYFDGDYAASADTVMREQLVDLKTLLGADYFARNPNRDIREAAGFLFLTQMSLNEFFRKAQELQPAIDLEEHYINSTH